MAIAPRDAARGIALGRVAFGIGMIAAPKLMSGWLGTSAEEPATQVAIRAVGIRDLILGAITLHTVSHPEVGPRWVAMCGLADATDAVASALAKDSLPRNGFLGGVAIGGGTAVTSFALAAAMKRSA